MEEGLLGPPGVDDYAPEDNMHFEREVPPRRRPLQQPNFEWRPPQQQQYYAPPQQMFQPPQQMYQPPQKITLTSFWVRDPQAWFRLAEGNFQRSHVTDSNHKFDAVLNALNEDTVENIRDILQAAHTMADPYAELKAELIRQFAPNMVQQLNGIVFCPELGGQAPSQLMRTMLALLPVGETAGLLFKYMFVLRLPADMREVVVKKIDRLDAKELAAYADTRWYVRNAKPPTKGHVAVVEAVEQTAVGDLTDAVAAISTGERNQRGGQGGRGGRGGQQGKKYVCFKHCKYGSRAYRCDDPKQCKFKGNVEARGQ